MAINKNERRFLRHWEEQRKGSKLGYYILYTLIWFFSSMLSLFFLLNNFIRFGKTSIHVLFLIILIALVVSISFTHFTYWRNNKRYRKIIAREMNEAKLDG